MSRSIPVRVLNQQTSAVLAEVAAGQEITVTKAGQPIARIVPVKPNPLDKLVAAGRAIPATNHDPITVPPSTGNEIDIAQEIARSRDEERW